MAEPQGKKATFVGMAGSSAMGWVSVDPGAPAAQVELWLNGEVWGHALANRPPPTVEELALAAGQLAASVSRDDNWFALKIPSELRRGQDLNVEIKADGDIFGQAQCRLFGGLKAKVTGVLNDVVKGYVVVPVGAGEPPTMEVRIDARPMGQAKIDPAGEDDRRRFHFALPRDLRDGEAHEVSVVWFGSDIAIPGSPQPWVAPAPARMESSAPYVPKVEAKSLDEPASYRLPEVEVGVVADLLARQALLRTAPEIFAEHVAALRAALTDPNAGGGGRRLTIVLLASVYDDIETTLAVRQLLDVDRSAFVRVLLPSAEAARFAQDQGRDEAFDQLALPLCVADFPDFVGRLPAEDLLAVAPARAVLTEAFLTEARAVQAGRVREAVRDCGLTALMPDGLTALSAVGEPGWTSKAVAIIRAGNWRSHLRVSRLEFDGAAIDHVELHPTGGSLGGLILDALALEANTVALDDFPALRSRLQELVAVPSSVVIASL